MVKRSKSKVAALPPNASLRASLDLISGAWTADVIWYLAAGERCFSELLHDLQGVSAKMLTARLRKLEKNGVILRGARPTSPPTVWYALTPEGREIAQLLARLVAIGLEMRSAP